MNNFFNKVLDLPSENDTEVENSLRLKFEADMGSFFNSNDTNQQKAVETDIIEDFMMFEKSM